MSGWVCSWRAIAMVWLVLIVPGAAVAESWQDGMPMSTGRAYAGAALLGEEIYVVGGDSTSGPRSISEIYDVRGNIWRPAVALPVGLQQFGMAELGGKIFVTGGYEAPVSNRPDPSAGLGDAVAGVADTLDAGGDTDKSWVYDPSIGNWIGGPRLPSSRAGHGLVSVGGKLYAFGGRGADASRVLVYDPGRNNWSTTGSAMPSPRVAAAYAVVDNLVYVIGGLSGSAATSRVDIFDTANGTWRTGPALPEPRAGHVAGFLNGHIHVTGGERRDPPRTYSDHFMLDTARGSWARGPALPTPRHSAVAAVKDGKFIVIGGSPGAGVYTVFTESDVVDIYSAE